MSEGPIRQRTGATFADVWPTASSAAPATPALSSPRIAKPQASAASVEHSEVPPAASTTRTDTPRRSATPSRPPATERTIARRDQRISTETVEGKLLGHGSARYRFQPTEAPSYYARLLTPRGVVTLWGRGLAQAITQSTTNVRIGDRVAFRRHDQDEKTGRVQWRAEKPEWFVIHDKEARRRRDEQLAAERAAQEDPDLARAFLSIRAAEAVAERRLSDPEKRLQFIAGVAARLRKTVQRERSALSTELHTEEQDTSSNRFSGASARATWRTR